MKNLTTLLPVVVIIVLAVLSFLIVQSGFFANKERRVIPQTQNITPQIQDATSIIRDVPPEFFSKEGRICIQVITSAKNPLTRECKEFPTPCDVPQGWQKVEKCD